MSKRKCMGLVLVSVLAGCVVPEGSCTELDKGDVVKVQIIEAWTSTSRFTFAPNPDLSVPPCAIDDVTRASYDFKIASYAGERGTCFMPECASSFPSASEALPAGGYTGADWLCVSTNRKVSERLCEARRFVGLQRINAAADPFSAPEPGQEPPMVLIRKLSFGGALENLSCADPSIVFPPEAKQSDPEYGDYYECADAWVVRITRR